MTHIKHTQISHIQFSYNTHSHSAVGGVVERVKRKGIYKNGNSRINCSFEYDLRFGHTVHLIHVRLNTMSTCIIAALCALRASLRVRECKYVCVLLLLLLRSFSKCACVSSSSSVSRWESYRCSCVCFLFHSSNFMSWGMVRRWFFLTLDRATTPFFIFSNISYLLGVEQDTCTTRTTLWLCTKKGFFFTTNLNFTLFLFRARTFFFVTSWKISILIKSLITWIIEKSIFVRKIKSSISSDFSPSNPINQKQISLNEEVEEEDE